MREFVQSAMDELRRYHLPKDVRDMYGWDTSHVLSTSVNELTGTITVAKLQDQPAPQKMHCHIDDYGRIVIPKEITEYLEWTTQTPISAKPAQEGQAIILSL